MRSSFRIIYRSISRNAAKRVLFTGLFAAAGVAHAQDNTFTWGAGNNFWDNPDGSIQYSNWSTDPLGSGAFIVGTDPSSTYDFTQIQAATFTGTYLSSAVGLSLSGGGLNLTGSKKSTIGGDLDVTGGSLSSVNAVKVAGNLNLSSGTVTAGGTGLNVAGQFDWGGGTLGSGGTVSAGSVEFGTADNQILTNQGALNISGASTWANEGTDLLNTGGAITIASHGSVNFSNVSTYTSVDPVTFAFQGAGIEGGSLVNNGKIVLDIVNPAGASSLGNAGNWFEVDSFDNEGTIDATATGQQADFYGISSFNNVGTIKIGSLSSVTMGGDTGPAVNSGMVKIVGDGSFFAFYSDSAASLLNSGTISIDGASSASIDPYNTFNNTGTIALKNGGQLSVDTGNDFANQNTVTISGRGSSLADYASLDNSGSITVQAGGNLSILGASFGSSYLSNTGLILVSGKSSTAEVSFYGAYANSAETFTNSGSLSVTNGALFGITGAYNFTNSGAVTVDGSAGGHPTTLLSLAEVDNSGKLKITHGADVQVYQVVNNTGKVDVGSGSTLEAIAYTQTGASSKTKVNGVMTVSTGLYLGTGVAGDGGTLSGRGTIVADVVNLSGTVAPGDPRVLTIVGDYTQSAAAVFQAAVVGNGGPGAVDGYDQLAVGGNLSLAGTIDIDTTSAYTGGLLTLFTYGGTFSETGPLTIQDLTQPGLHFSLVSSSGGVVTFASTPEPSTYLAMGMGVGLLALGRRKRKIA